MTQPRLTRAERLSMPLARHVVRDLAIEHGGCVRPVQLRRTDLDTGQVQQILVPCGHTQADTCPACAERAKALRAAQCREGWHLDTEPAFDADEPDDMQKWWTVLRSEAQQMRDHAAQEEQETGDLDELTDELDTEMSNAGIRGNVLPARPTRRQRSTRRRQDAPDLPRRQMSARTIGKTYTGPDGRSWRPSMFITLTCDSYGRVSADGTPADPSGYDYQRAARDAIHFAALFDRLIQNLRRYLGYDVQYFAVIEPQKRLAPMSMSRSGARSRASSCGRCSPLPITRCGGRRPIASLMTTRTCLHGMRPPAGTSMPTRASSCRPGTTR
jgi:hypothetical protein